MNPARRIGAATAIVALSTLSVGSAQAVEIPSDLEFSYTMNQPLIGQIRDSASTQCYQSIGDPFTMTMQAGMSRELTEAIQKRGNQIVCTISLERYMSNVVITGTAEASAQGQSGKGSFSLTCETGQKRSSFFSIAVSSIGLPEFGANPYGMEGNGYLSCTWSIAVEDAEKSQLAGTLELQGAYTKDSERVSCEEAGVSVTGGGNPDMTYCVAYDMNITAYLTGATGAYAGRTGEGTLTQRGYAAVTVPLKLETDSSCPPDAPNCDQLMNQSLVGCQYSATDPNVGGWSQWPALPPMAAPPGYQGPGWYLCGGSSGGGDTGGSTPEESPFDPSIPPCVTDESGQSGPPEGFSNCINPGTQAAAVVNALRASVRAALGQALSLKTSNASGTTRIVSPAQTTDSVVRPFGAKASSTPTVRLATVPGATCAVTATAGKAKTTLMAKGIAVKGQLDTKVTAASLRTKLKAAVGAQAVITAACSTKVGTKTVKLPTTSVTVKFT